MSGLISADDRAGAQCSKDRSGAAALHEAFDTGRCALTRLNEQGEALHRAEVVADSNQYVVDRSQRVVDNMTWSGWLANKFTKAPKPAAPLLRPSPALEKPGAIPKKVRSGFAWVPDVLPPRAPPTVPHEVRASGSARAIARAQRMAQMPAPTTPRSPLRPPSNPFELGFQARFVEALSDASTSEGVLVALLTETEGIASLAEHWHAGCAQLRALRMSTLYRDLPCPAGYSLVESRNRPGEYNFADDRGVRAPRGSRARACALRIHPLSCSAPLREG